MARCSVLVALAASLLSGCAVYAPFGKVSVRDLDPALTCIQVSPDPENAPTKRFAGPEDIETALVRGRPLAFISATPRRKTGDHKAGTLPGAIFVYDLAGSAPPRRMEIFGMDTGQFAPHGISLYADDKDLYLFAINQGTQGDRRDHVEIFRVEDDKLVRQKQISDTDPKTGIRRHEGLNDLTAAGPNSFYATMPGSFWRQIPAALFGAPTGSIVYVDEHDVSSRAAPDGLAFPNGIVRVANGARTMVYVTTSGGGDIVTYREDGLDGRSRLARIAGGELSLRRSLDNVTWNARNGLIVGSHPNMLRLAAHFATKHAESPSEVLQIKLSDGLPERSSVARIYHNGEEEFSGSSVGTALAGTLLIGQIFGSTIQRCAFD